MEVFQSDKESEVYEKMFVIVIVVPKFHSYHIGNVLMFSPYYIQQIYYNCSMIVIIPLAMSSNIMNNWNQEVSDIGSNASVISSVGVTRRGTNYINFEHQHKKQKLTESRNSFYNSNDEGPKYLQSKLL